MSANMDTLRLTSSDTLRWHLAFTKPCAEDVAKIHLERQGFKVYLPRVKLKSLRRGKWMERIAALFPRYLFVQLDTASQILAPIRSTTGVASVVRFGVDYTVVPNRVVEGLLANEDPATGLHMLRSCSSLRAGAAVRMLSGALAGLEGVLVSEDAHERVTVLLRLLGRLAPVRVDSSHIVAAA